MNAISSSVRVFRGGGWYLAASYCRSDYRAWNVPGYRYDYLGFRPVRRAR